MPKFQLNLKNLDELDRGKAALAFSHAIRTCAMDVIDRPGDKAKRKAVLTVELTPLQDKDTGALDLVDAEFVIQTKVLVRKTVKYPMLPTNDGILNFESLSPQDPRQSDLPFPGNEREETEDATVDSGDDDDSDTETI